MRVLALAAKKEDLSGALQLKERIEKQALATALATIGIQFSNIYKYIYIYIIYIYIYSIYNIYS